jgi:hypothetical protein
VQEANDTFVLELPVSRSFPAGQHNPGLPGCRRDNVFLGMASRLQGQLRDAMVRSRHGTSGRLGNQAIALPYQSRNWFVENNLFMLCSKYGN